MKLQRPLTFSDINLKVLFLTSVPEALNAKEAKHVSNFDKEIGFSLQFSGGLDIQIHLKRTAEEKQTIIKKLI